MNTEDNIYYNIVINNPGETSIPAQYSEQKVKSIVEHPEQYYLSVVRWAMSLQTVPIFTFKDNAYYVTLSYLGVDYSYPIIYQSLNSLDPLIRYVFSYQHMIDMINTTLQTCFTAIPVKPAGIVDAPFLTYSGESNLFTLYTQTQYALPGSIEIWFNNILYYFFDNFETFFAGENNASKKDFKFVIANHIVNTKTINALPYYYFNQEYVALFNFAELKTITFKTSTIPVRSEFTPNSQNTGNISFDPIMIDFEIDPEATPALYRGTLNYTPSGQYRLIDLMGREPISNINITVSYKDQNQVSYPVMIPPKKSLSLKLAFLKKDLYKSTAMTRNYV
jgi:hypothetical protein